MRNVGGTGAKATKGAACPGPGAAGRGGGGAPLARHVVTAGKARSLKDFHLVQFLVTYNDASVILSKESTPKTEIRDILNCISNKEKTSSNSAHAIK